MSLDDYDKMWKGTFPLAIYGCRYIDAASWKELFLKIWTSRSNPVFVGRWYFEYLYKCKILLDYVRIDKGTGTATFFTMHATSPRFQIDVLTEDKACERVIYGPSTSNQVSSFSLLQISIGPPT